MLLQKWGVRLVVKKLQLEVDPLVYQTVLRCRHAVVFQFLGY